MTHKTTTRSTKTKDDKKVLPKKEVRAIATRKVFFIKEELLADSKNKLILEQFYHPGKAAPAYFITTSEFDIYEVLEFAEPRRSWFIDNNVCSNGHLYMTTPIDTTLLALHYLRKYCIKKALSLESLSADLDARDARFLLKFVKKQELTAIADARTIDDCVYYKYNASRSLAWLAVKTRNVSVALLAENVHCGMFAQSANYNPAADEAEQLDKATNALRMACGIVGFYLDVDLYETLLKYFNLTEQPKEEQKSSGKNKRKSLTQLNEHETKKVKIEIDYFESEVNKVPTPAKARVLTIKEKQLAKGAKGTKSISSFFKK